jgi:hypothetical protein
VAVVPISAVLSKPCRDIITLFRPTSFRFHFPISCFFFPFLFFLLLLVITIRHYDFVINLPDFLLCQLIFVCILPKHKAIAGLVKQSEIQTLQTLQIRKISKYPTLGASDQFLQDKIPSESPFSIKNATEVSVRYTCPPRRHTPGSTRRAHPLTHPGLYWPCI